MDTLKKITLTGSQKQHYVFIKTILYLVFIITVLFFMYKVLFPERTLVFDFNNPENNKNTIDNPHMHDDTFIFDTPLVGDFSLSDVTFTTRKGKTITIDDVKISKSYKAFFFPTIGNIGFKNSSLITADNRYFIVSHSEIHEFTNSTHRRLLGFSDDKFNPISRNDLEYNVIGTPIDQTSSSYPEETLFYINDTYYKLLKDNILMPFVSKKAFLTGHTHITALEKPQTFLSDYIIPDEFIGFADGVLIATGESVFIVSDNKVYPVNSPETFLSMGYKWEDVIQVDSEEIGIYERGRLFTINRPHPPGTVFITTDHTYYIIMPDETKRLLPSINIAKSYISRGALSVDFKEIRPQLVSSSDFLSWHRRVYSISELRTTIGNNYRFSIANTTDTDTLLNTQSLTVIHKKTFNYNNAISSLTDIGRRIFSRYSNSSI